MRIFMEIKHIKNRGPKYDPPVFDVFYLHKYSHGFSYFNDIIIQFFQKMSVMTMATLICIQHLFKKNFTTGQYHLVEWATALHGMYESALVFLFYFKREELVHSELCCNMISGT